jgi:arsenate reductase
MIKYLEYLYLTFFDKLTMSVTIYHNPKCSKSRQTLSLLNDQGIEPTIIEYLKTPPSKEELTKILAKLKLKPRDLIRKKEDAYAICQLDDMSFSDEEIIDFMVKHPILIERPIVLANDKAAIGRPPENVLDIL